MEMVPAENQSTARNSQTKTSSLNTLVLVSCQWQTLVLTQTARNSFSALSKLIGSTESMLFSDLSQREWMLCKKLNLSVPRVDRPAKRSSLQTAASSLRYYISLEFWHLLPESFRVETVEAYMTSMLHCMISI